jgi:type IV pilus assembly protein PilC
MRSDVETGMPLVGLDSQAPDIFNRLYVYLVRPGEVSGNLDGILERVAAYLEKQQAIRGKIRSAMTYPVIVLIIALAVTYFLLTGIVPQFAGILDQLGGDLPLITRVLVVISDFLRFYWWLQSSCSRRSGRRRRPLLPDQQRKARDR